METTQTPPVKKWTSTAGPIQTKRVSQILRDLSFEATAVTRKTGVIGVREDEYTTNRLGGKERADVHDALKQIAERFNYTVTADNHKDIIAAAQTALEHCQAARPVEDERITPEQDAARKAEYRAAEQRQEDERKARETAFDQHFGNPEVPAVPRPDGQLAIVLRLNYNASDAMTDYFHPHAQIGHNLLLGFVRKSAQAESLARSVLSRYPALAARTWEWKTEKWSGGHGNYLISYGVDIPETHQPKERTVITKGHWTIEFNGYDKAFRPHKDYGAAAPALDPRPSTLGSTTGATVTLNQALNGVEVRFPSKPAYEVIAELKANGFRWARRSCCWYKRQSETAIATAHRIAGVQPGGTVPPAGPRDNSSAEDSICGDRAYEDRCAEAVGY